MRRLGATDNSPVLTGRTNNLPTERPWRVLPCDRAQMFNNIAHYTNVLRSHSKHTVVTWSVNCFGIPTKLQMIGKAMRRSGWGRPDDDEEQQCNEKMGDNCQMSHTAFDDEPSSPNPKRARKPSRGRRQQDGLAFYTFNGPV